jgi:hypothetical protein
MKALTKVGIIPNPATVFGTNRRSLHLDTLGPNRLPSEQETHRLMLTPEFLRRQAENCLRIARSCFDLTSAERLRLMAAELNAKATEMDEQDRQDRWPRRTLERNPPSS